MLNIKDLTKIYDHQEVLKNFNLDIKKGEIYSLLGANGAGKTTTINIICGLLTYDSGEIKINDEKFNHKSKYLLGIAPQENILYSQLSCEENLSFFGKLYGLKGTKLKTAIYKSLQAVNLLEKKDQTVEILSGGMQRRLNIALALIHNPQLLILDEPTTGLDIESRYEIWQLIQSLKQEGITILLTTHFLDEAEKLSDRIGIMKEGKIIVEGTLTQLKETIPAKELIFVTTEEKEKAIEQGKKLGFSHRFYQGELAFLSDKSLELTEIIRLFEGINLSAITKKTIDLEHIYLQVTK
ncbi:ABC transporter ATP-binding protein [Geminocystis sp. NIES-3709]|uniref:ABC transporter ATP-binding protein n=1 Tax=Geminocystis sp. NIES-3709 TaxID=1617448 RepID=UPI0008255C40|nr:ABC transporter ATP-binding protein [Geminocystis sp. NIES-3709]